MNEHTYAATPSAEASQVAQGVSPRWTAASVAELAALVLADQGSYDDAADVALYVDGEPSKRWIDGNAADLIGDEYADELRALTDDQGRPLPVERDHDD